MKHLKTLALAAIVATGLITLVGTGTASATTLFTDSGKTLKYGTGTEIHLTLKAGSSTSMTSGGSTVYTCTESTAKGKTSNETGEGISISLETFTWSGCNLLTQTITSGMLEIKWTSGTSGEVIGKETQWTIQTLGYTCTWGFGEGTTLGTITGGEAPVLSIHATVIKTAGAIVCPTTTGMDAEYVITTPHAIIVGA